MIKLIMGVLTGKKGSPPNSLFNDRKKVIAWHIRRKTSVRTEWITTHLKMGVTSNFSCYVRAVEQSTKGLLVELKNKITN